MNDLIVELAEASTEALVVIASDDTVVHWNRAAERLMGWAAEEVIGQLLPYHLSAARDRAREITSARFYRGETFSFVGKRRRKDGVVLDLLVSVRAVTDVGDGRSGALIVLRDTAEKADGDPSAALGAQTEELSLVVRLAEVIVGLNTDLDLATVLERVSDGAVALLAADAAVYVVVEGGDLVFAAGAGGTLGAMGLRLPLAESAVAHLIRTGHKSVVSAQARFPNSSPDVHQQLQEYPTFATALTTVGDKASGALYVMFKAPDRIVTPHELAVLELFADAAGTALTNASAYGEVIREREHKREVIDASADGMAVLDSGGLVRQWNPAAHALTGLAPEDVIGSPLPFPAAEPGSFFDHELPSGTWIEILCASIGTSGEMVVDFRDITHPKLVEQAKDLFLAVTSHELRTPITVIQGFASTLNDHWDELDDSERREAVERIASRTKSLAGLVEQLLLGSRAGAAMFEPSLAPFDLGRLVASSVAGLDGVSTAHTVVVQMPQYLPAVLGDAAATEVVISQLLENAVKYSPEGGEVRVSVRLDGGNAVLSVADQGVGIPEADLERIFERFYQSGGGDRRPFGGVGLGLYIVRRLVNAQGGTVVAHPLARGSRFDVSLPLATRTLAPEPPQQVSP